MTISLQKKNIFIISDIVNCNVNNLIEEKTENSEKNMG